MVSVPSPKRRGPQRAPLTVARACLSTRNTRQGGGGKGLTSPPRSTPYPAAHSEYTSYRLKIRPVKAASPLSGAKFSVILHQKSNKKGRDPPPLWDGREPPRALLEAWPSVYYNDVHRGLRIPLWQLLRTWYVSLPFYYCCCCTRPLAHTQVAKQNPALYICACKPEYCCPSTFQQRKRRPSVLLPPLRQCQLHTPQKINRFFFRILPQGSTGGRGGGMCPIFRSSCALDPVATNVYRHLLARSSY